MEENYRPNSQAPLPLYDPAPPSEFRGRTIQLIGWRLLGLLLTAITLGIGAPWAHCMVIRWEIKHTYISGKRLSFDGKGHQLLGRYLLWGLLTIVTLGIYALFIPVRMSKWKAGHTRFARPGEEAQDKASHTTTAVIFGCIIAAVALVALIVMVAFQLTQNVLAEKQPVPSTDGTGLPFGEGVYQYIIDADGNITVIIPNEDSGTTTNPGWKEEDPPTTTEVKPSPVTGPIVGDWVTVSKHISTSWEVQEFYFKSDGTFTHKSNRLYDYYPDAEKKWMYFLGGHTKAGWYQYENGVLSLYYTGDNASAITSRPPEWNEYDEAVIVVHHVSFSADGNSMKSDRYQSSEDCGQFLRMQDNDFPPLEAFFPNGY